MPSSAGCASALAAHEPGLLVVGLGHRPAQGLDKGQPAEGPAQVGELTLAGERGEEVVHGGGQALLGEEGEEGLEVVPARLEGLVLPLADAEDVDVQPAAPADEDRHLLAHEGIGQVEHSRPTCSRTGTSARPEYQEWTCRSQRIQPLALALMVTSLPRQVHWASPAWQRRDVKEDSS